MRNKQRSLQFLMLKCFGLEQSNAYLLNKIDALEKTQKCLNFFVRKEFEKKLSLFGTEIHSIIKTESEKNTDNFEKGIK